MYFGKYVDDNLENLDFRQNYAFNELTSLNLICIFYIKPLNMEPVLTPEEEVRNFYYEIMTASEIPQDLKQQFTDHICVESFTHGEIIDFWTLAGELYGNDNWTQKQKLDLSSWYNDGRMSKAVKVMFGESEPLPIVRLGGNNNTNIEDGVREAFEINRSGSPDYDGDGFSDTPRQRGTIYIESDELVQRLKSSVTPDQNYSLTDPYSSYNNIIDCETDISHFSKSKRICVKYNFEFDGTVDSSEIRNKNGSVYSLIDDNRFHIRLSRHFHELCCFRIVGNNQLKPFHVTIMVDKFQKDIVAHENVWINFCENPIPCDDELYDVFIIFNTSPRGTKLYVTGAFHSAPMLQVQKDVIKKGDFYPEKFGFRVLNFFEETITRSESMENLSIPPIPTYRRKK